MNETGAAPRLSVIVTTYNQAPWIAQALESVVGQQTSIDYEVIVGDDDSSDDTRSIAARVAAAHPSRIRLFPEEPRVGMHANLKRCLRAARGEYVAILNGDDYWLSRRKMQVQVEALDAHPEWSMCFHPVRMVTETGIIITADAGPGARPTFGTRDLLRSDIVPTCSAMFRRRLVVDLPPWVESLPMGDWTLWLVLSQHGPLGYLNDTMAVYRVRAGGAWSGLPEHERVLGDIRFLTLAGEYLQGQYSSTVNRSLSRLYRRLGLEQMKAGRTDAAHSAFKQAVAHNRLSLGAWRGLAQSGWSRLRRKP